MCDQEGHVVEEGRKEKHQEGTNIFVYCTAEKLEW